MSLLPLPTFKAETQKKPSAQLPYPELGSATPKQVSPLKKEWGARQMAGGGEENNRLSELETMLKEAQSRTAIVEQEAYDKAYAAGEKAGLALGEKRAEQILASMQDIVEQAEGELDKLQHQSIQVILELTEAITQKIVGESPKDTAKMLEQAVQKVLLQLNIPEQQNLVLSIHPNDFNMFSRMDALTDKIKLKSDSQIEQGSCKILSENNDVLINPKAMIEKAMQHIKHHFLKLNK